MRIYRQRTHTFPALNVSEYNEAVIKMIINGEIPNIRHVARTHSVWLFDLINLEKAIEVKYVNTAKQAAGVLTKGSFSQDVEAIRRDAHCASLGKIEAILWAVSGEKKR